MELARNVVSLGMAEQVSWARAAHEKRNVNTGEAIKITVSFIGSLILKKAARSHFSISIIHRGGQANKE
jgi:hypothetical protein